MPSQPGSTLTRSTAPTASPPVITADGLVKTYQGKVRALDGLSLSIPAGGVFGLLGPNGAGKSTTVKILTTLCRPDEGTATVAGIDVVSHPTEVQRVIGVVSQKTAVDITSTGYENIAMMGRIYGLRGSALRSAVEQQVEWFGLQEKIKKSPYGYSGGQRRRLDLAMGLVHRPQILFLDEPTAGLDPESRAGLATLIKELTGADGLTVLLTTHYLDEADELAGQLAIIDRGQLVAVGTPEELKQGLAGDTLHFELGSTAEAAEALGLLVDHTGPDAVVLDEATVHVRAANGSAALPRLLSTLDGAGLTVASAALSRPSLDQVYLRHTGRTFAGAQAAASEPQPAESLGSAQQEG